MRSAQRAVFGSAKPCPRVARPKRAPRPPLTPPGRPPGTKRTCGHAVTHAVPFTSSNWTFLWSPGGTSGPITFHSAVAVGHDISYLQRACLHDLRDGNPPVTASEHAGHGRRRRRLSALAADGVPVSDVYQACPGRSLPYPMDPAGMSSPTWSTSASTAPGAPLLFPGANLISGGRFAGAVLAIFAFAAASSAVGVWAAAAQGRGAVAGGPRWRTAVGAGGGVLRHAGHYGCMLISMSYSIWLLLALMGGHATAYAATAVATRRRAARQRQDLQIDDCGARQ